MNKLLGLSDKKYTMKIVCARTGLTAHAIRAWERRYNAVNPLRDENNKRYYTEDDVQRLILLKKATSLGFGISQIVNTENEELKELIGSMNVIDLPVRRDTDDSKPQITLSETTPQNYVDNFMSALARMDSSELENILIQAETDFGINALVENVLVPIMEKVGDGWRKGELRISHEHMASHIVRTFLSGILAGQKSSPSAPNVLVTTPADQWHDIGALIMAVVAASEGWSVTYMGANLPAEEIAGAVKHNNSKAVLLSIVYPEDDPVLVQEIRKLKRILPDNVTIVVGGRATASYKQVLDEVGAAKADSLFCVRTILESLRFKT